MTTPTTPDRALTTPEAWWVQGENDHASAPRPLGRGAVGVDSTGWQARSTTGDRAQPLVRRTADLCPTHGRDRATCPAGWHA